MKELIAKTDTVEADIYEYDIADLAGGAREPSYTNLQVNDGDGRGQRSASSRYPTSLLRLLNERNQKLKELYKRGERTGRVFFLNLDENGNPIRAAEVE